MVASMYFSFKLCKLKVKLSYEVLVSAGQIVGVQVKWENLQKIHMIWFLQSFDGGSSN